MTITNYDLENCAAENMTVTKHNLSTKVVVLLWILFVIMFHVCLCYAILSVHNAALCSPAGKGLDSWLYCVCVFLCFVTFLYSVLIGAVLDCIDS